MQLVLTIPQLSKLGSKAYSAPFLRLRSHYSDAVAAVAGTTACYDQGKAALMAMPAAITPAGMWQIVLCRACAVRLTFA